MFLKLQKLSFNSLNWLFISIQLLPRLRNSEGEMENITTDHLSRFDVGAAFYVWQHGPIWAGGCKGHLQLFRISKDLQFNLWTQFLQNSTQMSERGFAIKPNIITPKQSKRVGFPREGLGTSPLQWPVACRNPATTACGWLMVPGVLGETTTPAERVTANLGWKAVWLANAPAGC